MPPGWLEAQLEVLNTDVNAVSALGTMSAISAVSAVGATGAVSDISAVDAVGAVSDISAVGDIRFPISKACAVISMTVLV